jgi:four helix bundle protein
VSFADDLETRLYEQALNVVRFCRTLPSTAEAKELGSQLRRASTSASANYRASRRARSTKEWIAKVGIVLEELDETEHWLSLMTDAGLAAPPQNLLTEGRELRAILAISLTTAKRRYGARKP